MNPTEYRVWLVEKKKMVPWKELWHSMAEVVPHEGRPYVGEPQWLPLLSVALMSPQTKMVAEQWTGLKDTNGVNIYEGDILSWEPNETKRLELWKEGDGTGDLAVVEWSKDRAQFIASIESRYGGEGFEALNAQWYRDHWIVLGNVHEHKHLLASPPDL